MTTQAVATDATRSARVDMKFELVVIPVSDVDRAKEFYARLGWRLDADYDNGDDFRVIQFTPPGSGCSVIFGKNVTAAAPGSAQGLYLIVSDIAGRARRTASPRRRRERGVPRRRRRVRRHRPALSVWAAPGQRSGSRASQLPLVRLLPAIPTATAGCCRRSRRGCPAASTGDTTFASASDLARRCGAPRPRTGSTRSGRGKPTRTGRTGTPSTWCASRPAKSRRNSATRRGRGKLRP